MADFILQPGV